MLEWMIVASQRNRVSLQKCKKKLSTGTTSCQSRTSFKEKEIIDSVEETEFVVCTVVVVVVAVLIDVGQENVSQKPAVAIWYRRVLWDPVSRMA